MLEWVKRHPVLAGLLALGAIILFFLFRGRGSAQPAAAAPAQNPALQEASLAAQLAQYQTQQAQIANTNTLNAALENAQLQAEIQAAQIAGAVKVQTGQTQAATDIASQQADVAARNIDAQVQIAGTAAQAQTSQAQIAAETQAQIAGDQLNAILGTATIQGNTATQLATTQAGVLNTATAAQLAAQKDIDAATVATNSSDNARLIQQALDALTLGTTQANDTAQTNAAAIAAGLAATQDTNATALKINQNNVTGATNIDQIIANSNVDIAGIQANTVSQAITANQDIYNNFLNQEFQAQNEQAIQHQTDANNQQSIYQQILNIVSSGQLNKGGEGGAAQLAAIAALLGQPSVVAPVAQVGITQAQNDPLSSFLKGLGSGIGSGVTGGFTAPSSFFNIPSFSFGGGVTGAPPPTGPPTLGTNAPTAPPPTVH